MKIIGLMPVRNEAWCLGLSARVALKWCDELVMYCHACYDGSVNIARSVGDEDSRVATVQDQSPMWDEMRHRQRMLAGARDLGATHIVLVDADEVLTANLLPVIRDHIEATPAGHILSLPGYNLRGSISRYHSNGIWGNRWFSTAFKDEPVLHWGGNRFHHREPMGRPLATMRRSQQHVGGVMHLWGVSERRLIAKHALYKITERLRFPEKAIATIEKEFSWAIRGEYGHAWFGTPETWTYKAVPEDWWGPYADLAKYLDVDAEPWQEAECRRLIAEHGPRTFAGLDLFCVV